jgi:hypothetical protein
MPQTIEGVIVISVSILIILFRNKLAKEAIDFQKSTFKFNFGQQEIDITVLVCILVGVAGIILGVMRIMGLISRG